MTHHRAIGSHHRGYEGKTNEWLTPPEIIEALGPFDLDPCASVERPWDTAARHYTVEDDGLAQPWEGMVWLNPPYGPHVWKWLGRLAEHGNGIALTFARTETKGFFEHIWDRADGLLFLRGRLTFHHLDGTKAAHNSGAPSVLIAYGDEALHRFHDCRLEGALVTGWCIP